MGEPVTAYPYLVPALVLSASRTVSYTKIAGTPSSVTIAAGTYWPDALQPEAANNLIKAVGVAIDADDAGSWATFRQSGQGVALTSPGSAALTATATTNTEWRAWLGAALTGTFTPAQLKPLGWWPTRAPYALLRWEGRSYAETLDAWTGLSTPYAAGDVQRALRLELRSVDTAEVRGIYQTLEAVWHACARYAVPVRVYADRSAACSYLTSAMNELTNVAAVANGAAFTQGDTVWIDGEECVIQSIAGNNLTVQRTRQRAHVIYAPVSTAFVGTCVMASASVKQGPTQQEGVSPFSDVRVDLLETVST